MGCVIAVPAPQKFTGLCISLFRTRTARAIIIRMKTYVYTCRDKDGTLTRGRLEASDRADALRQLRNQGRLPLSLSEGTLAAHPQTGTRRAVLVAAAVLLAALAVVLILAPSWWPPHRPTLPGATSSARQSAGKASPKTGVASPDEPVHSAGAEDQLPADARDVSDTRPPVTAAMPDTAAGPEENAPEEKPAPAFKTLSEQLIAMLGQPGEERPPLPDLSGETLEDDFLRASANVLVIMPNDSDALAADKENVAWVKSYIAEAKKMGWTPGEYIRELENTRKQQAMDRREAILFMAEIERDYPDDADAVRTELNSRLEEKGVLPLPVPADE